MFLCYVSQQNVYVNTSFLHRFTLTRTRSQPTYCFIVFFFFFHQQLRTLMSLKDGAWGERETSHQREWRERSRCQPAPANCSTASPVTPGLTKTNCFCFASRALGCPGRTWMPTFLATSGLASTSRIQPREQSRRVQTE